MVTYVGRLVWEKGLTVFAKVIRRLEDSGIAHRSIMVGDGPARKRLRERLPRTLFTGRLSRDQLSKAYASSDIFFFPSDTETFGNVTLEAMASGLPAVCADAGGSSALVLNNVTGFLASPGDSEDFFHKVQRLLSSASLRRSMGARALARSRLFDWDQVMAQMSAFYRDIWHSSPSSVGTGLIANGTKSLVTRAAA